MDLAMRSDAPIIGINDGGGSASSVVSLKGYGEIFA